MIPRWCAAPRLSPRRHSRSASRALAARDPRSSPPNPSHPPPLTQFKENRAYNGALGGWDTSRFVWVNGMVRTTPLLDPVPAPPPAPSAHAAVGATQFEHAERFESTTDSISSWDTSSVQYIYDMARRDSRPRRLPAAASSGTHRRPFRYSSKGRACSTATSASGTSPRWATKGSRTCSTTRAGSTPTSARGTSLAR